MDRKLDIALWNVEWAKPQSPRGNLVATRLINAASDVICLTEGYEAVFPKEGHIITASHDFGYGTIDGRRKVLLWSRRPWKEVRIEVSPSMPPGRFVAGVTETQLGLVRFVGVCVPWKDAHVKTGAKNRRPWDDHVTYLQELRTWLQTSDRRIPTILLGDLNQRLPRSTQPVHVHEALLAAIPAGWACPTSGLIPEIKRQAIDHIVHTADLRVSTLSIISPEDETGFKISDHFGFTTRLQAAQTSEARVISRGVNVCEL